ncbi:MAG: hypothetical protein IH987_09415 [Planctomycetes bacterium]|nr:hypothetical protein [Planctomycetota bacterium]
MAKLPDREARSPLSIAASRVRTLQVEVELAEGGTGIVQIEGRLGCHGKEGERGDEIVEDPAGDT